MVPENHFLRKLEAAVDFRFIYNEVRDLYCPNNGRPGIDPIILVKYLLVGYLYGIESERRIEQEIQVNMAAARPPRTAAGTLSGTQGVSGDFVKLYCGPAPGRARPAPYTSGRRWAGVKTSPHESSPRSVPTEAMLPRLCCFAGSP